MEERLLQTATIETCHLAAIMFTDIAGFSRQMGANEARELLAKIYGWFTEGFDTRRICKKPKPFSGNSREREISQGDRA